MLAPVSSCVSRCEPSGLNWSVPTPPTGMCATGVPVDGSQSRTPSLSDEARRRPSELKSTALGPSRQAEASGCRPCHGAAGHSRPSASSQIPKPESRSRNTTLPVIGSESDQSARWRDQVGAADRIPDPRAPSPGRGDQQAARMGELEADHRILMAFQDRLESVGGHVPDIDPVVAAAGREEPPIAAPGRPDPISASNECDHTSSPRSTSSRRSVRGD